MNKHTMMHHILEQLAIDYNCTPADLLSPATTFTEAFPAKGRRPYPFRTPRLELISFGDGVVINTSLDILPRVRAYFEGKTREEIFNTPCVYGLNPYFLPDVERLPRLPLPPSYALEWVERRDIPSLYVHPGFDYALQYAPDTAFPETLVALARQGDVIVAIASACADSAALCQINIDVLPAHRGRGLAVALVNALTHEMIERGYIPYYFTATSNVRSLRVAVLAGYAPAWVHTYRARLELL